MIHMRHKATVEKALSSLGWGGKMPPSGGQSASFPTTPVLAQWSTRKLDRVAGMETTHRFSNMDFSPPKLTTCLISQQQRPTLKLSSASLGTQTAT